MPARRMDWDPEKGFEVRGLVAQQARHGHVRWQRRAGNSIHRWSSVLLSRRLEPGRGERGSVLMMEEIGDGVAQSPQSRPSQRVSG
jgi:hypothetical protein